MALIPNLRGRVVRVESLDQEYNKSQVILAECEQNYPNKKHEADQTVKMILTMNEINFKEGDYLSMYAYPMGGENTWEGEGHSIIKPKDSPAT